MTFPIHALRFEERGGMDLANETAGLTIGADNIVTHSKIHHAVG